MSNFNVECPYCGGRMTPKKVANMNCISYYCEECNAIMYLTHYDEEYVKEFLNTVKKKKDKVE